MLTYADDKIVRFAKAVAWERGLSIDTWPETASGVSRLIQHMIANHKPLPATDEQLATYQTLVGECVAKVETFQVERFATLPADRAGANKATYTMKQLLKRADSLNVAQNAASFISTVADEGSPASEESNPDF